MKRNLLNKLLILVIMFVCSFAVIGDASAATKVTGYAPYSGTVAHHRTITGGKNAWCINKDQNGPKKGTTLTKKKNGTYTKGYYIYILNHGDPFSDDKADVLEIQNALWMYRHWAGAAHSSSVPSSYSYYSAGKKLWNAAKKAGKNYTYKPTIKISSKSGTLTYNSGGYYQSGAYTVSLSDTASKKYTVKFAGTVPSGAAIYDKNGKKLGTSGSSISASSFVIRVPAANVNQSYSFTVNVTAPKTTYVNKAIVYDSGSNSQDLLSFEKTSATPSVGAAASVTPVVLKITKHDESTNAPLAGAKYRVFKNSDCTGDVAGFTGEYTTDANGNATIVNLPAGTYYIKEVAAPAGYSIATNSCLEASTSGKVAEFKNKKNSVVIYKHDNGEPSSIINSSKADAAVFGIYNDASCNKPTTYDGTTTVIPNASAVNGVVTFEKMSPLNPDTNQPYYYIKEITPPNGYAYTEVNCKRVAVNGTITFKDSPIGERTISVQKRDGFTHLGINDVRIGLFSDNTCTNAVQEASPTKNGMVTFNVDCVDGQVCTFYVKEMATPEGYIPKNGKDKAQCLEVKTGTTIDNRQSSVIIENMPYGNIKLLKLEAGTDKPMSGVEFALLDSAQKPAKDIDGNTVANQKTDDNGNLEFTNIVYGTYYLKEVKSDGKHKILKDPIKFELNSSTDSVKLARNGGGMYYLGDANGDNVITDADLTAYQNYVNDFDSVAGLSSNIKLALDINNDGNLTVADLKNDMDTLKLYLQYVKSGSEDVYSAATNYNAQVSNFCKTVGNENCSVENLEAIASFYDIHNTQNQAFQDDLDTLTSKQDAYDQAMQRYESELQEFNDHCNTNTDESTVDINVASDEGTDGYDCAAGIQAEYPGDERPTYDTICADHPMIGDYDNNCVIDDADLAALDAAIDSSSHDSKFDLNSDNEVDSADRDILARYIEFTKPGQNTASIMTSIDKILDNKNVLCGSGDGGSCSINNSELSRALNTVGKRYYLPTNIAGSSLFLKDEIITMKISKQIIAKSKEIPGAKIVIRDSKNNKFIEYTSTNAPKEFQIPAGKYTLTERVAPKGYKTLTTTISFQVLEDGTVKLTGVKSNLYKIKSGTDNHLIIYNEPIKDQKVPVPNTGSNVAIVSIVAGIMLVAGGGAVLYKRLI